VVSWVRRHYGAIAGALVVLLVLLAFGPTVAAVLACAAWLACGFLWLGLRIVESPRFMAIVLRGQWSTSIRRLPDVDGGRRGGFVVAFGPLRCWWLLDRHGLLGEESFAELQRKDLGR